MQFEDRWSRIPQRMIRRWRARRIRRQHRDLVAIAITGSVGKTSTATYLHRILNTYSTCHGGIQSNAENGIIRSLRKLTRDHQFYVQEVSGHRLGQLRRVLPLIGHKIGIVTAVGLDHYKEFRSREQVAQEKGVMVAMLPSDGVAVLNLDDEWVAAMASRASCRVITYGLSPEADLRATDVSSAWPDRLSLTLSWMGQSERLQTALFGELLLSSILASIAGGLAAGLTLKQCAQALDGVESVEGRCSVHRSGRGHWFIHDAYKSSYWTLEPALEQFSKMRAPRKTVVFGSFSDVPGADSGKYRRVAEQSLQRFDRVIFCGEKAAYVSKMLKPEMKGRLFICEDTQDAAILLRDDVIQNELVYLKSAGIDHLERLILAQDDDLQCWKIRCPLLCFCRQCEHSGLAQVNS